MAPQLFILTAGLRSYPKNLPSRFRARAWSFFPDSRAWLGSRVISLDRSEPDDRTHGIDDNHEQRTEQHPFRKTKFRVIF